MIQSQTSGIRNNTGFCNEDEPGHHFQWPGPQYPIPLLSDIFFLLGARDCKGPLLGHMFHFKVKFTKHVE
jgi:hypothetical protein